MGKKKIIFDSKGFSFVEVIVVLLITSLLVFGVIAFMSTSRNTYQKVNVSATLLEETMTVKRVLSEYIMEAKIYGYQENVVVSGATSPVKVIWVRARDTEKNTGDHSYFFVLDSDDNKLRYCVGNENLVSYESGMMSGDAITLISNECYKSNKKKYSVVGEHIVAMDLKGVARPDGADMVCVKLTYQYPENTGDKYFDEITVATRNAIMRGVIVTPTDPTESGNTENGNTENGNTENGNTENGNTENGNTENGNTENGNTENENTENTNTETPGTGSVNNLPDNLNGYGTADLVCNNGIIKEAVVVSNGDNINNIVANHQGQYETVPTTDPGKWKITLKDGCAGTDSIQLQIYGNGSAASITVEYIYIK